MLDHDEAARRFPQHRLDAGDVVLLERDGGVLAPERCVAAMLRRARALGAEVRTQRAVLRVEPRDGGGARLHIAGGDSIDALRVVVCAGPWTAALLPDLPVPLWVERQVNAWFSLRNDAAESFAPAAFPVFIRALPGSHHVYGVPSLDGGKSMKLAVHHEGARVADPDNLPREVTGADLAPLRDYATTRLQGVEPHPVRAITCMYTNTTDESFVIDAVPGMPGVVVVSACSGHGFKFATAIGDAAAQLAYSTSSAT